MELIENLAISFIIVIAIIVAAKYVPHIVIAKVRGIPIRLTSGWIFFVGLISLTGGWEAFWKILTAYTIVVLHELGHSLTAQKFGYTVKSIALWPFSGLASVEGDFTKNAKHEFWIALNGPAVNAFLIVVLAPFMLLHQSWLNWLAEVNFGLLMFNILPIYPMDGGRLLHSFFVSRYDEDKSSSLIMWSTIVVALVAMPLVWIFWSPVGAVMLGIMTGVCIMERNLGKLVKTRDKIQNMIDEESGRLRKILDDADHILDLMVKRYHYMNDPSRAIQTAKLQRKLYILNSNLHQVRWYGEPKPKSLDKLQEIRDGILSVLEAMRTLEGTPNGVEA